QLRLALTRAASMSLRSETQRIFGAVTRPSASMWKAISTTLPVPMRGSAMDRICGSSSRLVVPINADGADGAVRTPSSIRLHLPAGAGLAQTGAARTGRTIVNKAAAAMRMTHLAMGHRTLAQTGPGLAALAENLALAVRTKPADIQAYGNSVQQVLVGIIMSIREIAVIQHLAAF